MSSVTPQVAAAAASTRDEAELRALLRAKIETGDAYSAHRRKLDLVNTDSVTMDERVDFELESKRLWDAHYAACLAVSGYNQNHTVAA